MATASMPSSLTNSINLKLLNTWENRIQFSNFELFKHFTPRIDYLNIFSPNANLVQLYKNMESESQKSQFIWNWDLILGDFSKFLRLYSDDDLQSSLDQTKTNTTFVSIMTDKKEIEAQIFWKLFKKRPTVYSLNTIDEFYGEFQTIFTSQQLDLKKLEKIMTNYFQTMMQNNTTLLKTIKSIEDAKIWPLYIFATKIFESTNNTNLDSSFHNLPANWIENCVTKEQEQKTQKQKTQKQKTQKQETDEKYSVIDYKSFYFKLQYVIKRVSAHKITKLAMFNILIDFLKVFSGQNEVNNFLMFLLNFEEGSIPKYKFTEMLKFQYGVLIANDLGMFTQKTAEKMQIKSNFQLIHVARNNISKTF